VAASRQQTRSASPPTWKPRPRTASHALRHQPHTAAAVTEALSAVITVYADVLAGAEPTAGR
jgi:hypothetical protein